LCSEKRCKIERAPGVEQNTLDELNRSGEKGAHGFLKRGKGEGQEFPEKKREDKLSVNRGGSKMLGCRRGDQKNVWRKKEKVGI